MVDKELEAKVEAMAKLLATQPRDTKAIVALAREIDGIQKKADVAERDKAQVAITVLNTHLVDVLRKSFEPIVADGGIQKLHGEKAVVRLTIALDPPNEPSYNAVVGGPATPKAPKAAGGGGGGGNGQRGNCQGTGLTMEQLVDRYATADEKRSFNADPKAKNTRYSIAVACAKRHNAPVTS